MSISQSRGVDSAEGLGVWSLVQPSAYREAAPGELTRYEDL